MHTTARRTVVCAPWNSDKILVFNLFQHGHGRLHCFGLASGRSGCFAYNPAVHVETRGEWSGRAPFALDGGDGLEMSGGDNPARYLFAGDQCRLAIGFEASTPCARDQQCGSTRHLPFEFSAEDEFAMREGDCGALRSEGRTARNEEHGC